MAGDLRRSDPRAERHRSFHQQRVRLGHRRRVLSTPTQTARDLRRQRAHAMTHRSDREDHACEGTDLCPRSDRSRPGAGHPGRSSEAAAPTFSACTPDTAMEMPVPWKSQNDFHRTLEISHRTRDSHISTAASRLSDQKTKTKKTKTRTLAAARGGVPCGG